MHTLQQEHMRRNVAASALLEQHRSETAARLAEVSLNEKRAVVAALKEHKQQKRKQDDNALRAYAQLEKDAAERLSKVEQTHARKCDELKLALAQAEATQQRHLHALQAQKKEIVTAQEANKRSRWQVQQTEATEALKTLTMEHADAGEQLKRLKQELVQREEQSASTLQLKERHWEREIQALSYRAQDQQREVDALQVTCRETQVTCDATQSSLRKAEHELELARTQLEIERSRLSERHWHREKAVNLLKVRVRFRCGDQ